MLETPNEIAPEEDLRPRSAPVAATHPPAGLRYGIAFVLIVYGFAKLMGSQFTVLDSELDRPMGEVSGFWLTWYYFGYSPIYGSLLALAQIGGALLLTFRRTTLLGAVLLFGIVSNIVLIDLLYGVDAGATLVAFAIWVGLLVVLSSDRDRLLRAFWAREHHERDRHGVWRRRIAWSTRLGMLASAALFAGWAANVNNRSPTPLDGRWEVVAADGVADPGHPDRVYFERNRAHMSVFRFADSTLTRHFEVDPRDRSVRIWSAWLRKGTLLYTGRYTPGADRVFLSAVADSSGPARMELVRLP